MSNTSEVLEDPGIVDTVKSDSLSDEIYSHNLGELFNPGDDCFSAGD